jgi:hypothetical protein
MTSTSARTVYCLPASKNSVDTKAPGFIADFIIGVTERLLEMSFGNAEARDASAAGVILQRKGHMTHCDRERITRYIQNELSGDSLLDFLLHVDGCRTCELTVFEERQKQDARYYRKAKTQSPAVEGVGARQKVS